GQAATAKSEGRPQAESLARVVPGAGGRGGQAGIFISARSQWSHRTGRTSGRFVEGVWCALPRPRQHKANTADALGRLWSSAKGSGGGSVGRGARQSCHRRGNYMGKEITMALIFPPMRQHTSTLLVLC